MRLTTLILALLPVLGMTLPATAQNMFAPRVTVNDKVITQYEVEQRVRFLELLGAGGNLEEQAIDGLIEDRLRVEAAERIGVSLSDDDIARGQEEFAGRADLSAAEFISALGEQGVSESTFRDFVRGGLVWREVVRARFARRVDVTDAEIDRALSLSAQPARMEVLLSEIFLPTGQQHAERTAELAPQIAGLTSVEEFADAARRFSAAGSSEDGGRIDWMPIGELPGPVRDEVMGLRPGEVTDPITVEGALALFQLRDRRARRDVSPAEVNLRYKRLLIPGDRDAALRHAAQIRAVTDTCRDLYRTAGDLAVTNLFEEERRLSEVPGGIAAELDRLDENEVSTRLTEGDALVFLMLCERRPVSDEPPSRERVGNRLVDQRLNALADGYLEQLRADAHIRHE